MTLISIGIGFAIGLLPLRNSKLATFLISIAGGGVKMLDLITTGATFIIS